MVEYTGKQASWYYHQMYKKAQVNKKLCIEIYEQGVQFYLTKDKQTLPSRKEWCKWLLNLRKEERKLTCTHTLEEMLYFNL